MTGCPAASAVIAVLTFRRPRELARLLPLLQRQAATSPLPTSVLVVDNDPDRSAEPVVLGLAQPGMRYVHETSPGIAAARNRALREASDHHLLVFIDDDELPTERWLVHLLDLYQRTAAAAVVGPVVSEYAAPPEPWISAGEFFRRRRLPTGTPLLMAATNNLLLDLRQIRVMGLDFDPDFGLSGGEDTLFTCLLVERGGLMVWCDEAVVIDRVPESRLTRKWVLRRAFSSGNRWSRVTLELARGQTDAAVRRLALTLAGSVRLAAGGLTSLVGFLTGHHARQAKGLRTAARGAGMMCGAANYVHREYGRI
ncbi:glycosyltransferase [Arthrobacter sp. 260]|uniref:glycosyltransferase n=1 Tax=Arthrobacter sp. 260 TaxID=2735314 RepID=UPI001490D078